MIKLGFRCCLITLGLMLFLGQNALAQSPAPTISSVSPNRIAVGSASTSVAVVGTGFANGMVVRLRTSQSGPTTLPTTFVSSTELDAVIPNINLGAPVILQLSVFTGSTESGFLNVSVYSSIPPTISGVNPSAVAAQGTVVMTFAGSSLIGSDLSFDFPGSQIQLLSGTDSSLMFQVAVASPANFGVHTATLTKGSIGSAAATIQVVDGGSWQAFTIPDAVNRGSASVTVLIDGRILVAGGFSGSGNEQPITSAGLINPVDLSWLDAGSLNIARGAQQSIVLADGRVLVYGGMTFGGSTSSAEIFDPATNMWSPAGFVRNSSVSPILLPSGKVLLLPDEIYDPIAQTSTTINGAKALAATNLGCTNFVGNLLNDGTVFVACGIEGFAGIYNPSSDSIRPVSSVAIVGTGQNPTPYSIVLPDGRIFLQVSATITFPMVGVETNHFFFVYDPVADQFTPVNETGSPIRPSRLGFTTPVLLATDKVLAFDGEGEYAFTFDPSTNTVQPAVLPNVNIAGNSGLLKDGRILVGPPSPGVYSAEAFTFSTPAISSVSIVNTSANGDITIRISGIGFLSNSSVSYAGTPIRSLYVGRAAAFAFIPASLLAAAPNQAVTITNPGPGGGTSMPVTVGSTGQLPTPVITGIVPATGAQGATLTATISGTHLSGASSVLLQQPGSFGRQIAATIQAGGTDTQVPVLLAIASNATPGPYGVTVVTAGGSATLNSAFTVQRANIPVTVPQPISAVEQGVIQKGYVVITPASGSPTPTITATFGIPSVGGVQSQAGMFPGPMATDATLYVETIPAISRNLGVAIANPGTGTNMITLTLRDAGGSIAGAPVTVSLQPGQQTAQFVNQLFPADLVGAGFRGSLELQSSTAFGVLGFLFSGQVFSTVPVSGNAVVSGVPTRTLIATSVPNTPLAGTIGGPSAVMLPQFAMGGGWATQLALVDSGTTAMTGRIDIFDPNGDPLSLQLNGSTQSTFTYSIASGGTFVLAPQDSNGQTPF